jgi:hypothetical protein
VGLPGQIAFDASPDVRSALGALGRTEDVRFSPSGRRLALAGFRNDRIAVADLEVTGATVVITRLRELASSSLRHPHGVDFLDEETLVVGNRKGGVVLLRLPGVVSDDRVEWIDQLGPAVQAAADGPGSVRVDGRRTALVCNNWVNTVTRHTAEGDGGLDAGEAVLRKWLDLPDGLAVSNDDRWLATSNHNTHSVLIHSYPPADPEAEPAAVLRGVLYPHGACFGHGDEYLLVADAGRPLVLVFRASSRGWPGGAYPDAAIRVMDGETFARGHHNPQEGGPKGIDLHPRVNVLAVTAESMPLAFFDLDAALEQAEPDDGLTLAYELLQLAEVEGARAEAAENLSRLVASRRENEQLRRQGWWRARRRKVR